MEKQNGEQEPSLGLIPNEMANRLKNLKDKTTDDSFTKEQFLRIATLYFSEVFKRASRNKAQPKKLPELKRETGLITMISMVAARSQGVDIKTLNSVKIIKEVVLHNTGLSAMSAWLEKQKKDKDIILDTSGKKKLIEALIDLRFNLETQEFFTSFEKLRNTVAELQEWLKVVASLNKNATTQPHFYRLVTSMSGGYIWNKDRVYMSIIIGATLGKEQMFFSTADILQFCGLARREGWFDRTYEQLSAIFIEDLQKSFADIDTVKKLLQEMNLFHNKTVFYYSKKILFGGSNELALINSASKTLTQGALAVGRFTGVKADKVSFAEIKRKTSATLGNKPATFAYDFLCKYPYFLPWLIDKEVFRMVVFDSFNNQNLKPFAETYEVGEVFQKYAEYIKTNITVATVTHDIFNGHDLFGFNLSFFIKNKGLTLNNNKRRSLSDIEQGNAYKVIMRNISTILPPRDFSRWVSVIEEKTPEAKLDLTVIGISHLAASYLMEAADKRPKAITSLIEDKPWAKYIDEYALAFFQEKVGTYQNQKKKKK